MIKRISLVLGCLFLTFGMFFLPAVHAQETVTVDLSVNNGSANYVANGFLHGYNSTTPGSSFVGPMNSRLFRGDNNDNMMNSANYADYTASGGAAMYVLGNAWIDNVGGYNPSNARIVTSATMSNWVAMVTSIVNAAIANGQTFQWDIWNEPDYSGFWTGSEAQYQAMWQAAVNAIRGISGAQTIVGPSTCCTSTGWGSWATDLMAFAKTNNVLPNIVSFHEFQGPAQLTTDVANARAYLAANDPSITEISINEYQVQGGVYPPGQTMQYMAAIQRANITSAVHSCWNNTDCFGNGLDGFLVTGSITRAQWYMGQAYGNVNGTIVGVTPSASVDGVAGQNCAATHTSNSVFGRNGGSNSNVTFVFSNLSTNCSSLIVGGKVNVALYALADDNGNGSSGPTLTSSGPVTVSGDAVSVTQPNMGIDDVAIVILSAPTSSGPTAVLSPTSVNFGSVTTGTTSSPVPVTITNNGSSPLNISTINLGGANPSFFNLSNSGAGSCSSLTVPANSACTITFSFSPATTAMYSATATVTSNASPPTSTLNLSGTGITQIAGSYVSQNGGGNGSSCSSPMSVAQFNAYTTAPPGSTFYLCGEFLGAANGTMLFLPASGTASNPDSLIFTSGAYFSAPYWMNGGSGTGGAINSNQKSYWIINGGNTCGWSMSTLTVTQCNGSIFNTQNGTNLTYQNTTIGIDLYNSSHITVENIDIYNMYQRTGTAAEDPNWNAQACGEMQGTNTYIIWEQMICHDVGWGFIAGGDDQIQWGPGLEMYNADHDIADGPVHAVVFGNHFHDWAIWDNASLAYHHDGYHCFVPSTTGVTQSINLYDNQFDGQTGSTFNQFIYLEGNTSSTRCMVAGGTANIFNNVAVASTAAGEASIGQFGNATGGDVNDLLANNTVIGSTDSAGVNLVVQNATNTTVANNVSMGAGELAQGGGSGYPGTTTYALFDYNAYAYCNSFNCWAIAGVDSGSYAAWQAGSCTGSANTCDPHGIGYPYPMTAPNPLLINTACVPGSVGASCTPQTGSALIGTGKNLTALCTGNLTPLCADAAGNPRPTTGAWTIGAYQVAGSAAPLVVLNPTVLAFGSVQTGVTSILTDTLSNGGNATLTGAITISGTGYSLVSGGSCDNASLSVAAGSQCTVNVQFAPEATGSASGTLTFTTNASSSPNTVPLTGTGTGPLFAPTNLQIFIQP